MFFQYLVRYAKIREETTNRNYIQSLVLSGDISLDNISSDYAVSPFLRELVFMQQAIEGFKAMTIKQTISEKKSEELIGKYSKNYFESPFTEFFINYKVELVDDYIQSS